MISKTNQANTVLGASIKFLVKGRILNHWSGFSTAKKLKEKFRNRVWFFLGGSLESPR